MIGLTMRRPLFALLLVAGCRPEPAPAVTSSTEGHATTTSSIGVAAAPTASEAAAASPATASATASEKAIAPLTRDEKGLLGETIDFSYDGKDVKNKSRAYTGRIFLHEKVLRAKGPVPLIVFMHGLNRDLIPHRWIGGGNEGDVRLIAQALIEAGTIPPSIVAGPGSVEKDAVSGGSSFPIFDHDKFVRQVLENLGDKAGVDESRIVVLGHSGAGCSDKGGIIAAVNAEKPPLAVMSIDTCMAGPLAEALGSAPPKTHVVVTWQTTTWDRNFDHFRKTFDKAVKAHPAEEGTLRELDPLPSLPRAHDATVKQTFDKWLPRVLPPS
ncbi:MAG: hypothetical protein HOW73_04625 [Polyangiaceae bacterium]|nr:hypothetical protein [Polyangiaceae bacterium]